MMSCLTTQLIGDYYGRLKPKESFKSAASTNSQERVFARMCAHLYIYYSEGVKLFLDYDNQIVALFG